MNNLSKYCLAVVLRNEPDKISTCMAYNKYIWLEFQNNLRNSEIIISELFNSVNRLGAVNSKVQLWKGLMMNFQQKLLNSKTGEK